MSHDLDFVNHRGVQWKNTLDPYAVGNLSNRKCRMGSATPFADHNTLKSLDTLFFTFFYLYMNFNGISCGRVEEIVNGPSMSRQSGWGARFSTAMAMDKRAA